MIIILHTTSTSRNTAAFTTVQHSRGPRETPGQRPGDPRLGPGGAGLPGCPGRCVVTLDSTPPPSGALLLFFNPDAPRSVQLDASALAQRLQLHAVPLPPLPPRPPLQSWTFSVLQGDENKESLQEEESRCVTHCCPQATGVRGRVRSAMSDEDQYQLFLDLWAEADNGTDPSYVVGEAVQVCAKQAVNRLGARFIPAFYGTTFVLSYLGNGLVLYILYKYEKLSSVTNVFLLNLVLSNLLFAGSLPFWAAYHLSEWLFGAALCKLVSAAYFIGFYSSVLFLTLMTFDRYLAVVHAVAAAKSRKKAYAAAASAAVWCVSVAASLKELVLQNVWRSPLDGLLCEEAGFPEDAMRRWRLVSYYQQFLLFFLLPLLMVTYCYASIAARVLATRMKEKCRAIKLIFVIVFTFFACWTPYNVVILLRALRTSGPGEDGGSCSGAEGLDLALYVSRNIAYLYCCVSPVFYTFVGKKFQRHFRRLVRKRMPCLRRSRSLSSQSTTSQRSPHSPHSPHSEY
ncbi:C-C chemokine receptor type 1 [Liparis tanakae]|uniref:C-C chemokine receptor type 1 n=1 Tax=Liparis tanakae TaxID=230148 RepID=A0A4Z2EY59_9TELE|nr:C-C chemokine receptor type 1 [Liparis tanakae]